MAIPAKFVEKWPKVKETLPKLREALPKAASRVPRRTAPSQNRRIWEGIEKRIHYYADHPAEIDAQLEALDREWDIERVLETFASSMMIAGVGLSARNKRFLVLPGVVSLFLLQHGIQGWCPPVPLFRRLGVRTRSEIEAEGRSLKALKEAFVSMKSRQETITEQA